MMGILFPAPTFAENAEHLVWGIMNWKNDSSAFNSDVGSPDSTEVNATPRPQGVSLSVLNPQIGSGQITFSFQSEIGKIYVIENTETLNGEDWTMLQTNNGNGSAITVSNSANASVRFYRVRIQ